MLTLPSPSSSVAQPAPIARTIYARNSLTPPLNKVKTNISHNTDIIEIDNGKESPIPPVDLTRLLINQLQLAIQHFPTPVIIGTENDILVWFSGLLVVGSDEDT